MSHDNICYKSVTYKTLILMARRSEDGSLDLSNAREDSFLVVKDCRMNENKPQTVSLP